VHKLCYKSHAEKQQDETQRRRIWCRGKRTPLQETNGTYNERKENKKKGEKTNNLTTRDFCEFQGR